MFKSRSITGKNNICGEKVFALRKQHLPKLSQCILAEKLRLKGIDADTNAIQRIESGERFVTDIELAALAEVFGITADELLKQPAEKRSFDD